MSLRYLRSFLKVQLECLRLREKVRQRVYVIHVRFSEHISQFKFFEKVQYRVYGIYIFLSGLSYLHFRVKSTTSYTNFFVWIIVIQGMPPTGFLFVVKCTGQFGFLNHNSFFSILFSLDNKMHFQLYVVFLHLRMIKVVRCICFF